MTIIKRRRLTVEQEKLVRRSALIGFVLALLAVWLLVYFSSPTPPKQLHQPAGVVQVADRTEVSHFGPTCYGAIPPCGQVGISFTYGELNGILATLYQTHSPVETAAIWCSGFNTHLQDYLCAASIGQVPGYWIPIFQFAVEFHAGIAIYWGLPNLNFLGFILVTGCGGSC